MSQNYPKEFIDFCKSISAKRPKTVIDHILKHGYITSQQLKDVYGYNHPPRAVRDVRELGIPIETYRVKGNDDRTIAAYRFGKFDKNAFKKKDGRTGLSKHIKKQLIERYGCKCFIYLEVMDDNELQIDHRVPFEVSGDSDNSEFDVDDFMLLSGSANRAKSWACEHCNNWKKLKKKEICKSCYWANPENYNHVAMLEIRRTDIIWRGDEINKYNIIKHTADDSGQTIPEFIKEIIIKAIRGSKNPEH